MTWIEQLPSLIQFDTNDTEGLMALDFKKIGLQKPESKKTSIGAKYRQEFLFVDEAQTSQVAVSIDFEDVEVDGVLTQIKNHMKVYNEDGTVYCEKISYDLVRNEETLWQSRYKTSYNYLRKAAKGTPIENMVNAILDHYIDAVQKWLLGDPQAFKDAINNETDATIIAYLDTDVHPDPEITFTTKQSILKRLP